ncbi:MAG: hypothetical protein HYR76_09930, partial [Ignavibacteria bacterium]|nr:hypothetical protein [Ignavibacteria bacterium]
EGVEHEAVKGFSVMHKEKLLPALCHALGIEAHAHHVAMISNKGEIKQQIRALKKERDAALESRDPVKLKEVRRKMHKLKHTLRKAIA